MRLGLLAFLVIAIASCQEPTEPPTTFDGKVTTVWIVKNVFGAGDDTTLIVDRRSSPTEEACGQVASVRLMSTTMVAWSEAPSDAVPHAEVMSARLLRVAPAPTSTDCSPEIAATSIVLVR